jgi:hypothetical protein
VESALVEPTFPSLLFVTLDACLDRSHELVQWADRGVAACTLNDGVLPCGAMDFEHTGAALRTLQHVFVFVPMHERIGRAHV